mgnify:CR=1 FL=1
MSRDRDRRSVLSVMGAAAAGVALSAAPARAQESAKSAAFSPTRHNEDAWLDAVPGKHRVIIDAAPLAGGSDAVLYAGNLFMANKQGYNLDDKDVATVVCFRHYATIFGYNDKMWAKYGKAIADTSKYENPRAGEAFTANPLRQIETLAKRGVHFAVCGLATRRIAGMVATAAGAKTEDILAELSANLVSNGHLAAAGVIATTRAQEYGYSLLIAG